MFLHPSFLLFLFSLMVSIVMIFSANSWFMAWLCLELNLLMFIPMIFSSTSKYSVEASLKYFLIQMVASIMILASASIMILGASKMISFFMFAALMLKMGAAPCHQWLPSMVDGLSWPLVFILLTLQKAGPLSLAPSLNNWFETDMAILIFIISSALIGAWGGLIQSSLRKILAFSSIAHLSWILTAMLMMGSMWLTYFCLYSLLLMSVVAPLMSFQLTKLSQLLAKSSFDPKKLIVFLTLLSLGGLPPFTGFIPKLLILQILMNKSFFFLFSVLLTSAFFTLFFYLRVVVSSMFSASSSSGPLIWDSPPKPLLLVISVISLIAPTMGFMVWA
uniref:NADH-ubiquinone oxidoreductase chain 2 n=1 Tax=Bactrurus brachycaudus TaxID=111554 RepID=A0A6C0X4V3_9CRUS|nr:NADH dehydrogenase subunit 2 [Bactrurus brachycaudus]QIC54392.1 NADH dehydrogenase subunit 2 [Bactrurus brachycaudus]